MDTLVTGGTGLLGNNVVRRLLERGQSVRVLMRQRSDSRPFDGLDVETVTTDIRNVDQVRRACKGVDTVIHSAGWVHIGWSGGQMAREVNVTGTRNVAQAAQAVRLAQAARAGPSTRGGARFRFMAALQLPHRASEAQN